MDNTVTRVAQRRPYLDREARRLAILLAAFKVARREGWLQLSAQRVADACEPRCSHVLVRHHFGSPKQLRDAAVAEARERGLDDLIAAAVEAGL